MPAFSQYQFSILLTLFCSIGFYACSAEPESDGKASLSCSKTIIPDASFVIERLHNSAAVSLTCGAFRGDLPGPNLVQYRIYELVTTGGNLPGGGGGGTAPAGLQANNTVKVPRPGIAFTPALGSNLVVSAVRTAVEFQADPSKCVVGQDSTNCLISPYQFLGVVTPSSEWCSDSTGVMSYEFWMSCNGSESTFSPSVVSGAIKVSDTYQFNVTN